MRPMRRQTDQPSASSRLGGGKLERTQAGQRVAPLDVHGTAPTDTLSATPPERQRWVDLVLDPDQCIQDHGPRLVQV